MDQFVSTYQKDFSWPTTRIKRTSALLSDSGPCRCDDSRSRELKVIDLCGDEQDWSRTGPMGRLLDPKLYPAKTGPHPESEATKHDQPDAYIKKLEQKYPNLYGILQSIPADEMIHRVDQDRLKSTYQLDFSEKAADTLATISSGPCAPKKQQEKVQCKSTNRAPLKRSSKDQDSKDKKPKNKDKDDSQETRVPPWRSEYQDNISRLGGSIMRSKIHQKKADGPSWAAVAS